MKTIIAGEKRRVSEVPWVPGGGVELCIHHIHVAKIHKKYIREKLAQKRIEKSNILKEGYNLLFSRFITQEKGLFEEWAYARVVLSVSQKNC